MRKFLLLISDIFALYAALWLTLFIRYNFNFKELWHSQKANEVRKFIHEKKCACPLANQYYSNIMLHTPSLFKVLRHTFF